MHNVCWITTPLDFPLKFQFCFYHNQVTLSGSFKAEKVLVQSLQNWSCYFVHAQCAGSQLHCCAGSQLHYIHTLPYLAGVGVGDTHQVSPLPYLAGIGVGDTPLERIVHWRQRSGNQEILRTDGNISCE